MSFKAGSIPYTVMGVPDEGSGTRIVPPEELVRMLNDNLKLRDAVDRIEKHDFGGRPSGIKQLVRKQCVDDPATHFRYRSNKMVTDYAKKKAEGKV